jgi:hypothetical protein
MLGSLFRGWRQLYAHGMTLPFAEARGPDTAATQPVDQRRIQNVTGLLAPAALLAGPL